MNDKSIMYIYNKGSKNINNKNIPSELLEIADIWYVLSSNTNNKMNIKSVGSKIVFHYKGIEYHMFSQCINNYEYCINQNIAYIKEYLEGIGANNIFYRVGRPI